MNHIENTSVEMIAIDLQEGFRLSFGTLKTLPRVIYRLNSKGKTGIGEASIDFPFSNYDMWDIYNSLQSLDLNIINQTLEKSYQIARESLKEFPSALCAFDMALDDLIGKIENKNIFQLHQKSRKNGKALMSFGYTDKNIETVKQIISKGYIPKPKVGQGIEKDIKTIIEIDRLSAILKSTYILDFNGAYTNEEYKTLIKEIFKQNKMNQCIIIEQPTKKQEGISSISDSKIYTYQFNKNIKFVADESFITYEDAINCSKKGILLNYKIQKVGGIRIAKEIEDIVKKYKLSAMVGGTFPTAIGRTYDQQCACILKSTTLPSDGFLPSQEYFNGNKNIINEYPLINDKGVHPIEGDGLGININENKLSPFKIINPEKEYYAIRFREEGNQIKIILNKNQNYGNLYQQLSGKSPMWNMRLK